VELSVSEFQRVPKERVWCKLRGGIASWEVGKEVMVMEEGTYSL